MQYTAYNKYKRCMCLCARVYEHIDSQKAENKNYLLSFKKIIYSSKKHDKKKISEYFSLSPARMNYS